MTPTVLTAALLRARTCENLARAGGGAPPDTAFALGLLDGLADALGVRAAEFAEMLPALAPPLAAALRGEPTALGEVLRAVRALRAGRGARGRAPCRRTSPRRPPRRAGLDGRGGEVVDRAAGPGRAGATWATARVRVGVPTSTWPCGLRRAALAGSWPSMTRISVIVSMRSGGASGRLTSAAAPRAGVRAPLPGSPSREPGSGAVGADRSGGRIGGTGCGGGVAPTPVTFMAALLHDGPGATPCAWPARRSRRHRGRVSFRRRTGEPAGPTQPRLAGAGSGPGGARAAAPHILEGRPWATGEGGTP